jgi:hypothetical protein
MYFRKAGGLAALLAFTSVLFAAEGANTPQPGQLASTAVTPLRVSVGAPAPVGAVPTVTIANAEDRHDRMMKRLWITSMAAAVAGTSLDAASSWGKMESNSLLASSNGTFGAKGLGIKVGIAAAVIIPQICLRKHKELRGAFAIGNFGEAAIFSAAAIHNLNIRTASATN